MAFDVGGVAWLVLMAIVAAGMVSDVSTPVWLFPLFLVVGLFASYGGLLGIYPQVKDATPRLSLAGVGAVLVAATLVAFAVAYTVATGTVDEGPPFPVFPLILLATILSFLLLGLASFRTEVPSRTVGLLIIVPAVAWFGDIVFIVASSAFGVREVAGVPLEVIPMVGVVVASVAMMATGYLLRTRFARPDGAEPAADSTL